MNSFFNIFIPIIYVRFLAELFIFSENLVINAGMAEFRAQVYTCELCGEDGFKEEDLR